MVDKFKNVIVPNPPCWCPDARSSVSKLTVYGNTELLIENFRNVIYSDGERISVKTRKGILNIYGSGIRIEYYTSYEIKICGTINSVDWLTVGGRGERLEK